MKALLCLTVILAIGQLPNSSQTIEETTIPTQPHELNATEISETIGSLESEATDEGKLSGLDITEAILIVNDTTAQYLNDNGNTSTEYTADTRTLTPEQTEAVLVDQKVELSTTSTASQQNVETVTHSLQSLQSLTTTYSAPDDAPSTTNKEVPTPTIVIRDEVHTSEPSSTPQFSTEQEKSDVEATTAYEDNTSEKPTNQVIENHQTQTDISAAPVPQLGDNVTSGVVYEDEVATSTARSNEEVQTSQPNSTSYNTPEQENSGVETSTAYADRTSEKPSTQTIENHDTNSSDNASEAPLTQLGDNVTSGVVYDDEVTTTSLPLNMNSGKESGSIEETYRMETTADGNDVLVSETSITSATESDNNNGQTDIGSTSTTSSPIDYSLASSAAPDKTSLGNKEEIVTSEPLHSGDELRNPFKTMCFFGGWAAYRLGAGKFDVSDLSNADLVLNQCSHLIYAFLSLDSKGNVTAFDPKREVEAFAKLVALKQKYINLRIMIGLGGWDTPASVWSSLVANNHTRHLTARNILSLVKQYNFDGLVISWFYPGANWRGGQPEDKNNLVEFLTVLESNLPNQYELAIMGPQLDEDIEAGFNVPEVSRLVDYILIMSYDYFGSWDQTVNHLSPLYANNERTAKLNVNYTLNYWLDKGANRDKLVLGLTTYGRTFTLADPNVTAVGSAAVGPGIPGPYSNKPGLMGFNEICEIFLTIPGLKLEEDEHKVSPRLHVYDQWIGFEDEMSVFIKTEYAIKNKLKGVFVWTIDLDDFQDKCQWGRFPLVRAVLMALKQNSKLN